MLLRSYVALWYYSFKEGNSCDDALTGMEVCMNRMGKRLAAALVAGILSMTACFSFSVLTVGADQMDASTYSHYAVPAAILMRMHYDWGNDSYYDWLGTSESWVSDDDMGSFITMYTYYVPDNVYYEGGYRCITRENMDPVIRDVFGWVPYDGFASMYVTQNGNVYQGPAADGEVTYETRFVSAEASDAGTVVRADLYSLSDYEGDIYCGSFDVYFAEDAGSRYGWHISSVIPR